MFDKDGFGTFFFKNIGESQNSLNTYNSYLGRIDAIVGGLDERIVEDGGADLLDWMLKTDKEPFANHRSQCRSITRAYIRYRTEFQEGILDDVEEPTPAENAASVFKYERELQVAIRSQLARLEEGLTVDDAGYEATFASGRADILARDKDGCAVVIELKAGPCPKGALEQVLGYAQNWADEGESRVRSIVVAGSFTSRQILAAKRILDLELRAYQLEMVFVRPEVEISISRPLPA